MSTVTCHTEGCENVDIPLEMTLSGVDDITGEPWQVSAVYCGVCSQPIIDIQPPLDSPTDGEPDTPEARQ